MNKNSRSGKTGRASSTVRLLTAGVVLLFLALGFNALLTYGSLEKLYIESIVSGYQVVGHDLQRKLDQSLRFGKNIEKFIGMNQLLEATKAHLVSQSISRSDSSNAAIPPSDNRVQVLVSLPDGKILYSADEELAGEFLPEIIKTGISQDLRANEAREETNFVKYEDAYFITFPVHDRDRQWVASIVLGFQEKQVKDLLDTVLDKSIRLIVLILSGAFICLYFFLRLVFTRYMNRHSFSKKSLYIGFFLVVCAAQILFSTSSIRDFEDYYLKISRAKAEILTGLLKEDIEYLFSKGIQISRLVKVDALMAEIIAASPELSALCILDKSGQALYMATRDGVVDLKDAPPTEDRQSAGGIPESPDTLYNVHTELLKDDKTEGLILAAISRDVVLKKLHAMVLDSATVLVISILFLVEILILVLPFVMKFESAGMQEAKLPFGIVRPAAFLFLFGVDTSISFLPLHMEKLHTVDSGLSKDFLMGLPVSMQMLFTGIGVFSAGAWCDRKGWHQPFLVGLLLSGTGFLYAWLSPNALHYLFALGAVGLGYGLSLMASQGFVISQTDEKTKAHGLAHLYAGMFAGSICGSAAGGMLAERIGYPPVFFMGAVILLGAIPYTIVTMGKAMQKPQQSSSKEVSKGKGSTGILRFLADRRILALILFSSMPAAVAIVGFVNYYSPVYLKRIGTSQSDIGRIFMIYGLCLIYVGPFVTRFLDVSRNQKFYLVVSGVLGGLAFFVFFFWSGYLATAITVFMLGLSASFGACRNAYALSLKVSQELGQGKAMGVFLSAARIGQVMGPMTFSWLIAVSGMSQGIPYFGIAYLLLTLCVLLLV